MATYGTHEACVCVQKIELCYLEWEIDWLKRFQITVSQRKVPIIIIIIIKGALGKWCMCCALNV